MLSQRLRNGLSDLLFLVQHRLTRDYAATSTSTSTSTSTTSTSTATPTTTSIDISPIIIRHICICPIGVGLELLLQQLQLSCLLEKLALSWRSGLWEKIRTIHIHIIVQC